jgi:uncharacterized protein YwgA
MTKPISKQALYSMTSSHAKKAIERIVELMDSENESVALGACKVLLNKTLPDFKSVETASITKETQEAGGNKEVAETLQAIYEKIQ